MNSGNEQPEGQTRPARGTARLSLHGITKSYPGCLANDHIDLSIAPGEVHALLGENGAGKSTLVKTIYGVVAADSGEMFWQGEKVEIHNPAQARKLGIGMVFQHFSLFDTLTIAENISLVLDSAEARAGLKERIRDVSERYGLPLDPDRRVHTLSVSERQRVEIVRCLLQDPRLLIMDEPTSVLTPQETEKLFETLRRLAGEGCSILYISHKLEEIRELCEWATVLRAGRVSAECDPRRASEKELAEMMIGSELPVCERSLLEVGGEERLAIAGLNLQSDEPFGTDLKDVHLSIRGGEILGLAGVAGNGQKELLRAISGETRQTQPKSIRLMGEDISQLEPGQRRERGLGFVPEERLGRGAVPEMTLAENTLLTGYGKGLVGKGFLKMAAIRDRAAEIIAKFRVMTPGVEAEARSLSGGNLQKFIIGREILQQPGVLVAAYPTWGVDVGAATEIHRALIALRDSGAAVLVVSEDLDELFEVCDRIAVISNGRVSRPRPARETTAEELGLLMGGLHEENGTQQEGDGHHVA